MAGVDSNPKGQCRYEGEIWMRLFLGVLRSAVNILESVHKAGRCQSLLQGWRKGMNAGDPIIVFRLFSCLSTAVWSRTRKGRVVGRRSALVGVVLVLDGTWGVLYSPVPMGL